MSTIEDVWAWIRSPLENLKAGEPGQAWAARRESFLRDLGLQEASQHPVTEELFRRLDELPEQERTTMLGGDGIDSVIHEIAGQYAAGQDATPDEDPGQYPEDPAQGAGAAEEPAADPGYDEQAWYAFLAESSPSWDGSEGTWAGYRQAFLPAAGQRGFGVPATALIEYLATLGGADRVAALAQYGVLVTSASEASALQVPAQVPAQATDEFIGSVLNELLAEDPDLGNIPAERRRELAAEVLGQLQS